MIGDQLRTLESSGLVRLAQSEPELEYLFRHALVQEAAYGSLVKADRRGLHLAVGETLERLYPDRLTSQELAPVLARHFYGGGDDERALKYFTQAGDAAARVYANVEAVMHYSRALEVARRLGADGEHIIHLYAGLGRALELKAEYHKALRAYGEMEELARERADRAMALEALLARAKIHATPNLVQDPARAQTLLRQALDLALELGDRAAEAKILWNLMILIVFGGGDERQAAAYGERSLAVAREFNLREQLAFTLNDIYYAYSETGDVERARAAHAEARELWREFGNLPMLADNLFLSSVGAFYGGDFAQALAFSEEASRIATSIGNDWGRVNGPFITGLCYIERGEPDRGIAITEEAIALGESIGHVQALTATRAELARAYASLGAIRRGLALARVARAEAERIFQRALPWTLAHLARLCLLSGDLAEAEAALAELRNYPDLMRQLSFFPPAWANAALAEGEYALMKGDQARAIAAMDALYRNLRRSGVRLFIPDALRLKAQALLALGRLDEACGGLQEGRVEAEALESRRSLWLLLASLAEVEARRGNDAEAHALRRRASEIVDYIAGHIATPELRESFLALPDVREVQRET
ncbi:MAG: hypothetical protein HY023_08555 [Chloroflexi bacterium]|nr:hypothetical protein [Chloroflexota bacterium]